MTVVSTRRTCATMSWMRGSSDAGLLEIGGHALLEIARLADVEHLARAADHAVDAGQMRQGGDDLGQIRGSSVDSDARSSSGRCVAGALRLAPDVGRDLGHVLRERACAALQGGSAQEL